MSKSSTTINRKKLPPRIPARFSPRISAGRRHLEHEPVGESDSRSHETGSAPSSTDSGESPGIRPCDLRATGGRPTQYWMNLQSHYELEVRAGCPRRPFDFKNHPSHGRISAVASLGIGVNTAIFSAVVLLIPGGPRDECGD